jgi:hypothetical protein
LLEHPVSPLGRGEVGLLSGADRRLHESASATLDGDDEEWFRNATVDDVKDEYECDENDYRPIHSPMVWKELRQIYHQVMAREGGASPGLDVLASSDGTASGFVRNVTAMHSPGRGRGVFALERVLTGSRVWQAGETTVRFSSRDDYLRFLSAVPDEYVCDLTQFSYVQDLGQSSHTPAATPAHSASLYETRFLAISVDLEMGAYINANWDVDANIRFVKDAGRGHFIALRDIAPGDELIADYEDFVVENGWDIFGL